MNSMKHLLCRLILFGFPIILFNGIAFSQPHIESRIDSLLKYEFETNGKQQIIKVKSIDTIKYFAFGRKTHALIYFYQTIKNKHGIFKLDPARFYFSNNKLVYVRVYLPDMSKNQNTALYEFDGKRLFLSLGILQQSEDQIAGYINASRVIIEKSKGLY